MIVYDHHYNSRPSENCSLLKMTVFLLMRLPLQFKTFRKLFSTEDDNVFVKIDIEYAEILIIIYVHVEDFLLILFNIKLSVCM